MGIIETIGSWFSGNRKVPEQPANGFDVQNFIYIRIPGNIQPVERGERFEDRIDPVLAQDGLGAVSGGGSLLGDPRPDGTRIVEFCGIDIDATDRDRALVRLRELLPQLDAPLETELHYTRDGVKLQDVLAESGWILGSPRQFLHPGFDV
jgi:hypothetical protein